MPVLPINERKVDISEGIFKIKNKKESINYLNIL